MQITLEQQDLQLIDIVCDAALKGAGLQVHGAVNRLISTIQQQVAQQQKQLEVSDAKENTAEATS